MARAPVLPNLWNFFYNGPELAAFYNVYHAVLHRFACFWGSMARSLD